MCSEHFRQCIVVEQNHLTQSPFPNDVSHVLTDSCADSEKQHARGQSGSGHAECWPSRQRGCRGHCSSPPCPVSRRRLTPPIASQEKIQIPNSEDHFYWMWTIFVTLQCQKVQSPTIISWRSFVFQTFIDKGEGHWFRELWIVVF